MTAAMMSLRSSRSESAPIGNTPSAEPSTTAEVKNGTLSGAMPSSAAKTGPNANELPFAVPAASAARQASGASRISHKSRGRTLRGCSGGSTLVIAIGRMASDMSDPATAKAAKPPAPSGCRAIWPVAEAPKLAIW